MRRKIGFFSIVMALGSASFGQSPAAEVAEEAAEVSFADALVAALQDEMSSSADPAVRDFVTFAAIPAGQLMTQDVGYVFPQPTITPQPEAAVLAPAAARVAQGTPDVTASARFKPSAAARAQAVGDVAARAQSRADVLVRPDTSVIVAQPTVPSAASRASKLLRPYYSDRRQYVPATTLPPSAEQNLADWYRSQLPSQLWPGSAGAPPQYQVLFLSECWADDLPGALEDAIGGELLPAADRPVIDRARVELALARLGVDLPVPVFSARVSGNQRASADPAIAELNAALWAAHQSGQLGVPTVVLEKYCGRKLPIMYTMSLTLTNHYRVTIPQNLVATHSAPLLYAEACRRKTGSRYYNSTCQKWRPMQSGAVVPGIGRYRLVGMRDDEMISYLYQVDGSRTASAQNPQTVEPTLEP